MTVRVVDLFAGLGGWTEAAVSLGCTVELAANHWPSAVEWHSRNHPGTAHWTQDLHQADWTRMPEHDVLLASPSCQGHTAARGRERPHHDAARSTAWAVVSCAEVCAPPLVIVENVEGFRGWRLYPAWCQAMQALGYALAEVVSDAADHGVPQHRRRLFVVATRSTSPLRLDLPRREHVPVSTILDFNAGRWSPIDRAGRSTATLARIAAGRKAHGDRFVAPYYGSGSGETGRSLDRPIGTITTRARWAVVDGNWMRMLTLDESRAAMGFRPDVALPQRPVALGLHLLGNAVCPPQGADVLRAALNAA